AFALARGREALRRLKEGKQEEAYAALSEAVHKNPRLGRGKALDLLVKLAECLRKQDDELQNWRASREREGRTLQQASPALALLAALQEVPAVLWRQIFDSEKPAAKPARPKLELPKALWDGLLNWVERMAGKGGQEPYPVVGLVAQGSFDSSRKPRWLEQAEREGYWEDRGGVIRGHPGDTAQTVRGNLEAAPEMQGGVLLLESGEQRALLLLPFGGRRHREKVRLTATEGERLRARLWSRETLRPRVLKALLAQAAPPRARLLEWIREGLELGRLEGRGWKRFLEELEEGE
ncbi:MAG: hypothetical protein N2318_06175, partial [Meiothermus sp.]|nr:hypothetical protein [Meiothermus sp.]